MKRQRLWINYGSDERLFKLWTEGKSDVEIGRILGWADTTIRNARRELGLPPQPHHKHTPESRAAIGKATIERHKDPVMGARMRVGLLRAGISKGLPRLGTPERKRYNKLQHVLGKPAAQRALREGTL